MRKILIIVLTTVFFASCEEETYDTLDSAPFNNYLKEPSSLPGERELAATYYYDFLGNASPAMGRESITNWGQGGKNFTSIKTKQRDDSIDEVKYTIVYTSENGQYNILEIRKSWTCQQGRGHTRFGNGLCN